MTESLVTSPKVVPPTVATQMEPPMEDEADSMVKIVIEVALGEECWVHYRDREGMTGERLLTNGAALNLELAGPVKLTVGNAGAAQMTIDGRIYRELGLPGQVIHTEVTRNQLTQLGSGGIERQ